MDGLDIMTTESAPFLIRARARNRNRITSHGPRTVKTNQTHENEFDYAYACVHEHDRKQGKHGMTLLEMLAYVAVLAVLFNIAAGALMMSTRLSAKGTATLDRANAIEEVRAEFTEAVRAASAVRPSVCDYQTGPEQVVLETPPPNGELNARYYTVFGFLGTEFRISKLRIKERDGAFTVEGLDTYGLRVETVKFSFDTSEPASARLVTLELDVKDDHPTKLEPVLHRFSAAPRCTTVTSAAAAGASS